MERRSVLALCGCACSISLPREVSALAEIVRQPSEAMYDVSRNALQDMGFARGMATGMKSYENAVEPVKSRLFSRLLAELPSSNAVVIELGMGSFPNAKYYASGPAALDIVGVDPNDSMPKYGTVGPEVAVLRRRGYSLREIHGVAESLPLADGSADAVVCTLTLCSVTDPVRSLAEVRRVLKPGGQFLFLEHVLSETDAGLAAQQVSRSLAPSHRACPKPLAGVL